MVRIWDSMRISDVNLVRRDFLGTNHAFGRSSSGFSYSISYRRIFCHFHTVFFKHIYLSENKKDYTLCYLLSPDSYVPSWRISFRSDYFLKTNIFIFFLFFIFYWLIYYHWINLDLGVIFSLELFVDLFNSVLYRYIQYALVTFILAYVILFIIIKLNKEWQFKTNFWISYFYLSSVQKSVRIKLFCIYIIIKESRFWYYERRKHRYSWIS